jgi:ABC-2 type transport system permease protein
MKQLWLTAKLDIVESLRARWFQVYSLVFGGIVALLFLFGLTESRVLGFIGLSRLLVTYIQLTMAILPIFVLITTVRSVAGDREAGVFEYLLSLPVSLAAWFWGKILGRYIVIFLPVFGAMVLAVLIALVRGIEVPWGMFGYYTALLAVMAACFLGIGMLISALARSTDMAQGAAFVVWLTLLLFLDLILLGVMIQGKVSPEVAVTHGAGQPAAGVPHRRAGAVRPATDRARPVGLRHPRPVRRRRLQGVRPGLSDRRRVAGTGGLAVDLAGGTGDVARLLVDGERRVVVCDPSLPMMMAGRTRGSTGMTWLAGEAEKLPFADASVDLLTVAFGLRNATHLGSALAEIRRVLKPGARFVCLEFSRPAKWLAPFYDLYSFLVIPRLGALVAREPRAYQYLVESIRRFPDQAEFAASHGAVRSWRRALGKRILRHCLPSFRYPSA